MRKFRGELNNAAPTTFHTLTLPPLPPQANAIGVQFAELHFLSELHPHFSVFPTFPINLAFKRTEQDVFDFPKAMQTVPLPGVPRLDPQRTVDGERGIEIVAPVPVSSEGLDLEVRNRCTGAWDKGGNIVLEHVAELVDAVSGKVYTRMSNGGVGMKQGGFGGPSGPKAVVRRMPEGVPDAVGVFQTTRECAMLYRLCGDYNPLHADDEFGRRGGFKGHILQGLGTWNIVAHDVLRLMGGSDPERFKTYGARFRNVVYPGDVLETKIWRVGSEGGVDSLVFETRVKSDGRVALSNGYATLKSATVDAAVEAVAEAAKL